VAIFMIFGVVILSIAVVSGISQVRTKPGSAAALLVVAIAFGTIWFTLLWRLLTIGLYVGQIGLRYRSPIHTTVVPWSEVKGVRLAPLTGRGMDVFSISGAVTIWIDRKHGESVQTWVNNKGADFLGRRRAFQAAFDAIEQSVKEHKGP
jgi:hypothetical protein